MKAVHLFERVPVRKQTLIKNPTKCLAKIRRLMQAYALARPAVRFRLHILKATNNKADFVYAPKVNSNVEDAVFKVIGKDCALQCDWAAIDSDGFEIHAFLPKPTAVGSRIANQGAFISIDARPVSCSRGMMKPIASFFKEKLREANMTLSNVKEPFLCMNIICPSGSYDPNIEPAKDDVMFDDGSTVLMTVRKLLDAYYPQAVVQEEGDVPTSAQLPCEYAKDDNSRTFPDRTPLPIGPPETAHEELPSATSTRQLQWRSSMYGIDEDDLVHLSEDNNPIVEEEDGRRAADISNPWTIARMNATIKPNRMNHNEQLLSPAKSSVGSQVRSSPPTARTTPCHTPHVDVATPQTSPRLNGYSLSSSRVDGQQVQHDSFEDGSRTTAAGTDNTTSYESSTPKTDTQGAGPSISSSMAHTSRTPHSTPSVMPTKQRSQALKLTANPTQGPDDLWFGQPMRGSSTVHLSRKQHRERIHPSLSGNNRAQTRSALSAESLMETHISSKDNTDIRDFFRQGRAGRAIALSPFATRPVDPHTKEAHSGQLSFEPAGTVLERLDNLTGTIAGCSRERGEQARPLSQPSYTRYRPEVKYHGSTMPGPCQAQTHEGHPQASYQTRPSSMDSNFPPVRSSQPARPRMSLGTEPDDHIRQSNQDMAAFFKAYQDHEEAFVDQSSRTKHRRGIRATASQENVGCSRPQRRRASERSQRTKSSKLSLERVPQGHHLQNVILHFNTSIVAIIQSARHLDMCNNSLGWSYPATCDTCNAFLEPVTATKVTKWVMKLDAKLGERFEVLPGADVRSLIHEAIQRVLDEKQNDAAIGTTKLVEASSDSVVGDIKDAAGVREALRSITNHRRPESLQLEVETSEFDISQFVELDAVSSDQAGPGLTGVEETVKQGVEEFGDAIDDEMLLDL